MNPIRTIVFVDFWNLVLGYNKLMTGNPNDSTYKIPWDRVFPEVMLKQVSPNAEYLGTRVYTSHSDTGDEGLKRFYNAMQTFNGYKVIVKDRKRQSNIKCKECHNEIDTCPHCAKHLIRFAEKAVDTALAIDLFQYAMDKAFDKAVLVSSDTDFIPAVEYIERKGTPIIHAGFRNQSNELRKACFGHFFIEDVLSALAPGVTPFALRKRTSTTSSAPPLIIKKKGDSKIIT